MLAVKSTAARADGLLAKRLCRAKRPRAAFARQTRLHAKRRADETQLPPGDKLVR